MTGEQELSDLLETARQECKDAYESENYEVLAASLGRLDQVVKEIDLNSQTAGTTLVRTVIESRAERDRWRRAVRERAAAEDRKNTNHLSA